MTSRTNHMTTADLYSDENKQIVQRRGGWFVTGESWSGPWRSEQSAELARNGNYDGAHKLDRTFA